MSGLIWAGIGKGIADAGSTIGGFMMKRIAADEDREDRQRERRQELEDRREYEEKRDALYRRTADQQAAGRSGGGSDGLTVKDISEGGGDEAMLARSSGMTVPELRALRKYSETGDTEPFKRDVTKGKIEETGDPYNPEVTTETSRELPPGFEREARAKMQTLARIEESYRFGSKYDDLTKGRRNQQEVDMSDAAMREPGRAGIIGQGMAAGKGNDIIGGDSNVTRNKFTGETSTTKVGDSVITENKAQAAKYGAEADKAKRDVPGKDVDLQTLQQIRLSAERTLQDSRKALTEFDKIYKDLPKTEREKRAAEREGLVSEVNAARANLTTVTERLTARLKDQPPARAPAPAPAAAPAPARAPAPAPAAASGGGLPEPKTQADFDKLPKGTRFKAPDGTIRIK